MVTRILILNPFKGRMYEKEHCQQVAEHDTIISFEDIGDIYPLPYVTYVYYRHLCADAVVDRIIKAEGEGFEGVFIACMYDPGLLESRELVDIPVVGAFEASTHYACMLGHSYSIVTVERKVVPCCWELARLYGVSEKLVSVRHIGIPANKLYPSITSPEEVVRRTIEVSRRCVEEDGAEVIVPGCTLQSGSITHDLGEALVVEGAPILDPVLIGFKILEVMVTLRDRVGLRSASRVAAFKKPPFDELKSLRSFYGKDETLG
jgi:allantoin racemase